MADTTQIRSQETLRRPSSGWLMLFVNLLVLFGGIALLITGIVLLDQHHDSMRRTASLASRSSSGGGGYMAMIVLGALMEPLAIILFLGHFTLQPNEARVMILFGSYRGTVRESGFFWANPFYTRVRARIPADPAHGSAAKNQLQCAQTYRTLSAKISLRARNFNSEKIKVNDKRGNPIEIAAVIVWRVADTARAAFDVDDFESYVQIQSESAIRHIASLYSYDNAEEEEPTLRTSANEVAEALERELAARLVKSGVTVDEARLTHLAYAPEIAQAMLRRQQAEAVIAARTKIVHGAVSMVDMALRELSDKGVVQMDEERKAAMVSNLLVVLCGESEVTPVVNTGTLYN
jgi:regulator of protease activity HflC (stomatin/prohibitin superfamily)